MYVRPIWARIFAARRILKFWQPALAAHAARPGGSHGCSYYRSVLEQSRAESGKDHK